MSSELINKADEILSKHPIADRHSYFQLKNYIIGKEHTLHGKLWQCVRELKTRRDSVDAIKLQIEDVNDKLELIDIAKEKLEIAPLGGDFVALLEREKAIKHRQLDRDKSQLEKNGAELVNKIKSIQEEINYFIQAFEALKKMGDWKDFDDEKAQEVYWNAKLEHELNMRLVLGQPIDIELGRTIESLSDTAPVKQRLMGLINERQRLAKEQLARIEEK
tara:strand:- start:4255 stop:4911 length:657 start_codon:yes stop_codon:yes gene_type:complete